MNNTAVKLERLLSIVIATKNRTEYAVQTVRALLAFPEQCFEVIVQDNSDYPQFSNLASDLLKDNRLNYKYTPPPFSSIDNFNAGIESASGKYICLIGDDDGISKQLLSAVQWANDTNVDCLVGSIELEYRWPGATPETQRHGTLVIQNFSGSVKNAEFKSALTKLITRGGTNYLDLILPKLYHGVVKRSCLEQVKALTGNYLGGLSPDIYSAVSLSLVINSLVKIDFPITIPGICPQSTSVTEGRQGAFSLRLSDAPHFRSRETYVWNKEVPPIYCVTTIWADSCVSALKDMGRQDLVATIGSRRLLAEIIWNHPKALSSLQAFDLITEKKWSATKWRIKLLLDVFFGPFLMNARKLLNKLVLRIRKQRTVIHEVRDISEAMGALDSHLQSKNISIQLL